MRARCSQVWRDTCSITGHHASPVTSTTHSSHRRLELILPHNYLFQHTMDDRFQWENNFITVAERVTGWLEVTYFPMAPPPIKSRHYSGGSSSLQSPLTDVSGQRTNLLSAEMDYFYKNWGSLHAGVIYPVPTIEQHN